MLIQQLIAELIIIYKMRNKDEKQGKKALIALITNLPLIGRMLNYME